MPPNVRIPGERILETALRLVIREGPEAIHSKRVTSELVVKFSGKTKKTLDIPLGGRRMMGHHRQKRTRRFHYVKN